MENISMARWYVVHIEVEYRLKEIINHAIAGQGFVTSIKETLYPVQVRFCFSQKTKESNSPCMSFIPISWYVFSHKNHSSCIDFLGPPYSRLILFSPSFEAIVIIEKLKAAISTIHKSS